jgi:hypothetical protein
VIISPSALHSIVRALFVSANFNLHHSHLRTTLVCGCTANPNTHCFVTSPEMTTVLSLAGTLNFNPVTDSIPTPSGKPFKFAEPDGDELPTRGFDAGEETFQAPPADGAKLTVAVSPKSQRLQLLAVRCQTREAVACYCEGLCTHTPAGLCLCLTVSSL